MFKPMKKIVKIGDTGAIIAMHPETKKLIAALGFPTEPLEEDVEEIEGVIE